MLGICSKHQCFFLKCLFHQRVGKCPTTQREGDMWVGVTKSEGSDIHWGDISPERGSWHLKTSNNLKKILNSTITTIPAPPCVTHKAYKKHPAPKAPECFPRRCFGEKPRWKIHDEQTMCWEVRTKKTESFSPQQERRILPESCCVWNSNDSTCGF